MKTLVESLFESKTQTMTESLFDNDLVSKDTGLEYLYGLVDEIRFYNEFTVNYFDVKKIKRDFNRLSYKFPPKDWNKNKFFSAKKFCAVESTEILRELALIIVASIKSTDIKKGRVVVDDLDLEEKIHDVIKQYTTDDGEWVDVWVNEGAGVFTKDQSRINIQIHLGRTWFKYTPNELAGYIIIKFNTSELF